MSVGAPRSARICCYVPTHLAETVGERSELQEKAVEIARLYFSWFYDTYFEVIAIIAGDGFLESFDDLSSLADVIPRSQQASNVH